MKKRNVALVLAATMMLSLAGCAGSNEKTEDTKKAQTETENKTEGKEDAVQIDGALSIYCGAGMQQPCHLFQGGVGGTGSAGIRYHLGSKPDGLWALPAPLLLTHRKTPRLIRVQSRGVFYDIIRGGYRAWSHGERLPCRIHLTGAQIPGQYRISPDRPWRRSVQQGSFHGR